METAQTARDVLANAAMVTEISDREGEFYAKWARLPGKNLHILTRAMQDRLIAEGGGRLSSAPLQLAGALEAHIQRARTRTAGLRDRQARPPARRSWRCVSGRSA